MFLWKQLHPSHIHVKVSVHTNASRPPRAGCISLKLQRIKLTTDHFYFHRLFFPFKQKTGRAGTLLCGKARTDWLRASGGWCLTLKRAASSNRAARTKRSRKRPGMWASLHSIIWPWCAPEEFNVWKRSGIRDGGRSRWLVVKREDRGLLSQQLHLLITFSLQLLRLALMWRSFTVCQQSRRRFILSKTWALFIRSVDII